MDIMDISTDELIEALCYGAPEEPESSPDRAAVQLLIQSPCTWLKHDDFLAAALTLTQDPDTEDVDAAIQWERVAAGLNRLEWAASASVSDYAILQIAASLGCGSGVDLRALRDLDAARVADVADAVVTAGGGAGHVLVTRSPEAARGL